jgi:SAM-dependent methyltransferase
MTGLSIVCKIEDWIAELRSSVLEKAPDLIEIFDIYAGEAIFGRAFIDANLKLMPSGCEILEIGAGSMLLSCQLVREGYVVSSLEPTGYGYTHMSAIRKIVLDKAEEWGVAPRVLAIPAEELKDRNKYNFAFSVNVMEHVADARLVILRTVSSLLPGGSYRFVCPNYTFPYEPHFNIPTLFTKGITEFFFKTQIYGSLKIPDPVGTWRSLNWITVSSIRGIARSISEAEVIFQNDLLVTMISRVTFDPLFSARRSLWLVKILRSATELGLHKLCKFIPLSFQPLMDCTFVRKSFLT